MGTPAPVDTGASKQETVSDADAKLGFHALQEKQAAEKKAKKMAALKKLGKAFKKEEPIEEDKLLQQILQAAQSKDAPTVIAKARKGLGEDDVDDVDETGFLEELTAIKSESSLKKLLSALSRGEGPDQPSVLYDLTYWQSLACGGLTIMQEGGLPEGSLDLPEEHVNEIRGNLREQGYFRAQPSAWDVKFEAVYDTVSNLIKHGWPAVFIYMYDEAWQILERAWDVYEQALGVEAILEPTVYCWYLQSSLGGATRKSASQNFGMPHRDYRWSESCLEDGEPKLITVWIPLTPTTVSNGTIYVLPKEYDGYFDKNTSWEHMRGALKGEGSVVQELRFPVQGATPIEAEVGNCLGWMGNLLHWGSRCSTHAPVPRANLGCTFRRRDVESFKCGLQNLTREEIRKGLDLPRRMQHITRSLLLYSCHFDLPRESLPAQFWAAYDKSDTYTAD